MFGDFSDFFLPIEPRVEVVSSAAKFDFSVLNESTCLPSALHGRLDSYVPSYEAGRNYVDRESGSRLHFDLSISHGEDVLVHEQCGGGDYATDFLRRVTFTPGLQGHVLKSIAGLPPSYVAVHVRNTDYRTDYAGLLQSVARKVYGRSVLVCSDDAGVILKARSILKFSKVLTMESHRSPDGKPLHQYSTHATEEDRQSAVLDSFSDLVALGMAQELYFTEVNRGFPSGFSRLSGHLCSDKRIVGSLLGLKTASTESHLAPGKVVFWRPTKSVVSKWLRQLVKDLKRRLERKLMSSTTTTGRGK